MAKIMKALAAIGKGRGKKKGGVERRKFDPAIRKEMQDIHAGKMPAKSTAMGRRDQEEDVTYQAGGSLPSRFRKKAKKRQTSIPVT